MHTYYIWNFLRDEGMLSSILEQYHRNSGFIEQFISNTTTSDTILAAQKYQRNKLIMPTLVIDAFVLNY